MSYLVLARKYRPETFRDVVGQEPTSKTLCNSIIKGRIAHAFLFAGPRGVGKTSMARILSKALNCSEGPTPEPCLECEHCRAIASGNAMDVVEIDAASNRGIDNIRSLRENVRYAPAGSRFKIYIIDEVHMLTVESFNALLKTLEEPPDHVKFIFATTEPQKLPETVRSRCQCYEFRRISTDDIAARLEFIMKNEGLEYDPGVLRRIAAGSRGGMRDAQSLLDQIIAFSSGGATFESLNELTGSLSPESVDDLVDAVVGEKVSSVLDLIDRFFSGGTRAADILRELIDHFRLLMIHLAGAKSVDIGSTGGDEKRFKKQAEETSLEKVLICLQIAMRTLRQSRWFDEERVLVELALVKMARLSSTIDIGEAISLLRDSGNPGPGAGPVSAIRPRPGKAPVRGGPAGAGTPPENSPPSDPSSADRDGESQKKTGSGGQSASSRSYPSFPSNLPPERGKELKTLYSIVLSEVEKRSKTTAMSLRGFQPLRLEDDVLYLKDTFGEGKRLLGPDDAEVSRVMGESSHRVLGRFLRFKVEALKKDARDTGVPSVVEKTKNMFEGDIV